MIKAVTDFIAKKASLTRDTDLFAGHRLDNTPDACDVVLDSTGGTAFFDFPARADVVYQVLSRAKTYFTAEARAWVIYDAIFRDHSPDEVNKAASAGWRLPLGAAEDDLTYEIMTIEPLSPPQYIGQDEKKRFEFSTNYLMRIKKL